MTSLGLTVRFKQSGRRSNDDGRRHTNGSDPKIGCFACNGVESNRGVGVKSRKGKHEGVGVSKRFSRQEQIRRVDPADGRNGKYLCSNGRGKVAGSEVDHLLLNTGLALPKDGDILGLFLTLKGRELRSSCGGLFVDDLLPGGHVDPTTDSFWHFIPVQVVASFIHDPDQLLETWVVLHGTLKREGSRESDHSVGSRPSEHGQDGVLCLVEREQNSCQIVEAAGEEGSHVLDRVREVNSHSLAALLRDVLSDQVDLARDIF